MHAQMSSRSRGWLPNGSEISMRSQNLMRYARDITARLKLLLVLFSHLSVYYLSRRYMWCPGSSGGSKMAARGASERVRTVSQREPREPMRRMCRCASWFRLPRTILGATDRWKGPFSRIRNPTAWSIKTTDIVSQFNQAQSPYET